MSQFYVPWGADSRLQIRNQFASTLELHKQSSYEYQEGTQRQRSPSLPPIRSGEAPGSHRSREALNRNIASEKRFVFYDEDGEGDTSGYGSETVHQLSKGKHHHSHGAIAAASPRDQNPLVAWQTNASDSMKSGCGNERFTSPPLPDHGAWSALGARHAGGGGEEGRLRWGDRGVATGRLWEPQDPTARLPQMQIHKKGTPSWVERGLNMLDNNAAEVLVIDQQSTHSGGLEYDRSSCNGSDGGRNTFLRGQNVPIEPEVKAQRETKRMKALELQTAILNQLEEREKQRRDERERKIREERMEELRIQRQQEEDRQKLSEERRKNEEKQETEQRKMEALKKAIEDAEKKAKLEKERMYTNHKYPSEANVRADTLSLNSGTTLKTPEKGECNKLNENIEQNHLISPRKQLSPRTCYENSPQTRNLKSSEHPPPNSSGAGAAAGGHSPRSPSTSNVNLYLHGLSTMSLSDAQVGLVPIGITPDLISPMVHTQNAFQLAVLVPHNTNSLYTLSQPLSLQSLNSVVHIDETSQTGKILTPRKYRNLKSRDASTQTDPQLQRKNSNKSIEPDKNVDKDYENIDENAPQEGSNTKKERRFRSEERYNKKEIETRPKWGVNRPAAQYKKQSEKDPFYSQKRKIRQKYRSQPRQYLSHSSEESRSPSPPTQSETFLDTKSRISLSQSHWRSKRSSQELFRPSNMSVETVNISPLEYNHLGQVSVGEEITAEKHIMPNVKMSPTKRITLSQKFINDKYGNRKLWSDAEEPFTERSNKSNYIDLEVGRDRKKMLDRLNTARRDGIESEDQDLVLLRTKF